MILPNIVVNEWAYLKATESGMDSIRNCRDKKHFISYSKNVDYNYNSRGFRDVEWPNKDLDNVIWCFGDSFTVGLGQPFEETWVRQLNKTHTTINISMDGASVNWITNKVINVVKFINPKIIIIQWTFLHRREHPDTSLSDTKRRIWYSGSTVEQDVENFIECIKRIENITNKTKVIHSWIPLLDSSDSQCAYPKALIKLLRHNNIILENAVTDNIQLDLARDGFHYDILTSKKYVKHYTNIIGNTNDYR